MNRFLFFLVLVFLEVCPAKTVLISDIDDTLKISHVRNKWRMLVAGPKSHSGVLVPGMLQAIKEITKRENVEKIYYVSKIPRFINLFYSRFLSANGFPEGTLVTPFKRDDFKFKAIQNIIELEKPDKVILIGDNGERDSEVYERIREHFSNTEIEFVVRIRIAYEQETELPSGQFGFREGTELFKSLYWEEGLPFSKSPIAKFCRYVLN